MKKVKLLSLIFAFMISGASIGNGDINKLSETLEHLENLFLTEFVLTEKLKEYIEDQRKQSITFSNKEYYLRELNAISHSIDEHLSVTSNTLYTLKRVNNLQKAIENPLLKNVCIASPENVTILEDMCTSFPKYDDYENAIFDRDTQKLCNGEISQTPDFEKNLKCRYTQHENSFLKIAPFKEEDVYLNPHITIYHNVISDEEIEILKNLSYPLLEESLVRSMDDGIHQSKTRISRNAWLTDEDHEFVAIMNRRVQQITDLNIDTAEDLQVSYYLKGGYFNTHYDFDQSEEPFKQLGSLNRIATLMFYLNDVKEGGRTVFPYLNVSLIPEKGSAVLWYNLLPNGVVNYFTLHAGCPVIAGTKWVANKWFHELGQELRRPCTLKNDQWNLEDGTLISL